MGMIDRTETINSLEREIKRIRKEPKRKMLGIFMTVDEAEDIVTLLKEQEPKLVELHTNAYGTRFYFCPKCKRELFHTRDLNFCEKCGQAVKWE